MHDVPRFFTLSAASGIWSPGCILSAYASLDNEVTWDGHTCQMSNLMYALRIGCSACIHHMYEYKATSEHGASLIKIGNQLHLADNIFTMIGVQNTLPST
jgi:hypothetical protein